MKISIAAALALLSLVAVVAETNECKPQSINVTAFRTAGCGTPDRELSAEWQKYWDSLTYPRCSPIGPDLSTNCTCTEEGFSENIYDGWGCTGRLHTPTGLYKWGQCTRQAKIYIILTQKQATSSLREVRGCQTPKWISSALLFLAVPLGASRQRQRIINAKSAYD